MLGVLVGSNSPDHWRVWGFDGLSGLSVSHQAIWIIASLLISFFVVWLFRFFSKGSQILIPPFILTSIVLLVLLIFPTATLLRGDGQMLVNSLGKGQILYGHNPFYNSLILFLINQMGFMPVIAFRILALIAAAIYLWALWHFIGRFQNPFSRGFALIAGIMTGSLPIFAGMVELYALPQALMMASMVLSIRDLEKERFPWKGLIAGMIALGFHIEAMAILPALSLGLQPKIGKKNARLAFLVLCALGLAGAVLFARRNLLAPLGPLPEDHYTLWSFRHSWDMVNLVIWAAPVLLATAIPLGRARLNFKNGDTVNTYLLAASFSASAFVFLFSPELGAARDADLLTLFAVPVTLWVLWNFYRSKIEIPSGFLGAAVFVGLLTVGAQMGLQHDEDRSVARHIRQLEQHPERSGYGWEVLGVYYRQKGDKEQEEWTLKEAVKHSRNGRYFMRLAQIEIGRGNYAKAELYADTAVQILPDDFHALGLLGYTCFFQNKLAEASPVLSKAINLGSDDINHWSMIAFILFQNGDLSNARDLLLTAMKKVKYHNEQFYCIFGMVEEKLGNYSDALKYYNQTLKLNPTTYWGESAKEGSSRLIKIFDKEKSPSRYNKR
jgi:tetratricopeptide (TPR) repeat protein